MTEDISSIFRLLKARTKLTKPMMKYFKGLSERVIQQVKVTYPTVVMEIYAHQKPSGTPLVNDSGKFSLFCLRS